MLPAAGMKVEWKEPRSAFLLEKALFKTSRLSSSGSVTTNVTMLAGSISNKHRVSLALQHDLEG